MRDFIQKNFWLKVFSLVLAALIWFVLQANLQTGVKYPENPFRPTKVREFNCPVTLLMSPTDRTLYKIEPPEVVVKVQGEGNVLAELDPEDVQAYVNISIVKNPQGGFKVETILPREVSLRSILPPHVFVSSRTNQVEGNAGAASTNQLH